MHKHNLARPRPRILIRQQDSRRCGLEERGVASLCLPDPDDLDAYDALSDLDGIDGARPIEVSEA
jgi:hypothetical protein